MRRRDGDCPVCGRTIGRESQTELAGMAARIYWHTELIEVREYCVERADGATERVKSGRVSAKA